MNRPLYQQRQGDYLPIVILPAVAAIFVAPFAIPVELIEIVVAAPAPAAIVAAPAIDVIIAIAAQAVDDDLRHARQRVARRVAIELQLQLPKSPELPDHGCHRANGYSSTENPTSAACIKPMQLCPAAA